MALLDVANLALLLVGEKKITSLTGDDKAEVLANTVATQKMNECFDMPIDWKFATARLALTAHTADPAFGSYDYYYIIPSACRRIIALVDEYGDTLEIPWRRELHVTTAETPVLTPVIACNESAAYAKYIYLISDTALWPSWFTWLAACKIALVLVEPLRQDGGNLKNKVMIAYENALNDAKAGNAIWDVDTDGNTNLDYGNTSVINAADYAIDEQLPRIIER